MIYANRFIITTDVDVVFDYAEAEEHLRACGLDARFLGGITWEVSAPAPTMRQFLINHYGEDDARDIHPEAF